MIKWEYTKLVFRQIDAFLGADYIEEINIYGEDGWEICASFNTEKVLVFIFKRPKQQ